MVINHVGELMSVHISAGNVDDRTTVLKMVEKLRVNYWETKVILKVPL
jgi:hypothetical protein